MRAFNDLLLSPARILAHHWKLVLNVGIGGLLVGIAYPNFTNYQAKAVQSEARINLGGIYVAEKVFYKKHKRYGTFDEIGFKIERSTRYTYRIDRAERPGVLIPPTLPLAKPFPENTVVSAGLSATSFTATATGNIDDDSTIDQWHVNDQNQGLQRADVNDIDQ